MLGSRFRSEYFCTSSEIPTALEFTNEINFQTVENKAFESIETIQKLCYDYARNAYASDKKPTNDIHLLCIRCLGGEKRLQETLSKHYTLLPNPVERRKKICNLAIAILKLVRTYKRSLRHQSIAVHVHIGPSKLLIEQVRPNPFPPSTAENLMIKNIREICSNLVYLLIYRKKLSEYNIIPPSSHTYCIR